MRNRHDMTADDELDELDALRRELQQDSALDPELVKVLTTPLAQPKREAIVQELAARQRSVRAVQRTRAGALAVLASAAAVALAFWTARGGEPEATDVAREAENLSALAAQFRDQRKYDDVEPLLRRALDLRERSLGPKHTLVAASLTELADFYQSRDMHAKAEQLYRRAFQIQPTAVF